MPLEYILRFDESEAQKVELTGGKGSSLAILSKVSNICVPEGFSITTEAYDQFIREIDLDKRIEELERASLRNDKDAIVHEGNAIRQAINSSQIPQNIQKSIKRACEELYEECSTANLPLAVRSSATAEDLPTASFAGQMESYLNQRGLEQVLTSVNRCWASLFGDRAIDYRNQHKITHSKVKLAVSVLRMIEGYGAGVGFSVDIVSGKPGITLEANYGIGESVVQGTVTPDYWLLNPQGERILMGKLGNKTKKVIYLNEGGTIYIDVDRDDQEKFVFDNVMVKRIAHSVRDIGNYYRQSFGHKYVDTEFVVDNERRLYFVQARPETAISRRQTGVVTFLDTEDKPLLRGGECASYNIAIGKAKTVVVYDPSKATKPEGIFSMQDNPDERDIIRLTDHVKRGDILIATKTVPSFETIMKQTNGIVTEEGGLSCHAAIIAREFNIPCIVGMNGVLQKMGNYEGQVITIDPSQNAVYLGNLSSLQKEGNITDVILRAYEDEPIRRSIERLTLGMGRLEDTNIWTGRPIHPAGMLQLGLYDEAFNRLEQRFGINLTRKIEGGVLKTPRSDNPILNERIMALGLGGLEQLFDERVRTVEEFDRLAKYFDYSPDKVRRFVDVYTRMIEHFHLRWQFTNLVEIMQKNEMLRLPVEARPYVDFLYATKVATNPRQKEREYAYEELLSFFKEHGESPKLAQKMERYAKRYPRTDSVDLCLPAPEKALKDELRKDATEYRRSLPTLYTFDLPQEFDERLLRVVDLNARQTVQKEVEPYIHIGGQYAIREGLIELGKVATSHGYLRNVNDVFGITPSQLVRLSEQVRS